MLIAMVVVGVSSALVMAGLLVTARAGMGDQIKNNAEARAQDVALLVKNGSTPNPIPGQGEDLLVQVLDNSGFVIASSASIADEAALVSSATIAPGRSRTFPVSSLTQSGGSLDAGEGGADPGEPFLIASVGVRSPTGPVTVLVAASLNPVQQLSDLLLPRLAIGLPLIMIVVGLTVWLLTGWALQPVEAIRSEAEEISAHSLTRRVPVPRADDAIGRLAATMNRMLDRLESSSVAQRRFVSDASHELKSPVTSIRMMLDVARQTPPPDVAALLEDLAIEDARLEQMLANLLVLARVDENSVSTHVSDVDLDDIVVGEARSASRSRSISVDVSEVHPVRVHVDPSAAESLIRNLMENAARHAATTIWATVTSDRRTAVVTVSDDGPGIAREDWERVFERFVRLDASRARDDGGTGLGLAVCRALTRSMGGQVRVVDPLHGGATLEVRLPLP